MSNEIQINKKFRPLFNLLAGKHPQVDTVILTGGRASTKSFNAALFSLIGVVDHQYKVLYARFTNQSIGDSIKTEVSEKIDLLNIGNRVIDNKFHLQSTEHGGKISFKGIKTGSKNQTANLKSLSGFNVFIVDEAEEIPSLETFEKVYLSIRSNDKRNLSVLILNPTTKEHWIFQEYFEKRSVDSGFCGIVGNVMYIHSSYLDAPPGSIPENIINYYRTMQELEPQRYENIVEGGWVDEPDGVLFSRKELKFYDDANFDFNSEDVEARTGFIDIADTGEDHLCMPIGFNVGPKVFIHDVVFTKEGSDVTPQLCAGMINKYRPEYVRIESNMGGSMYKNLLAPHLTVDTDLFGAHAKANKHTRITMMAGMVKKYCYFREDYEKGSPYDLFMRKLTSYLRVDENEHDDAPDALAGLLYFIRRQLPHLYDGDGLEIIDGMYSKKSE